MTNVIELMLIVLATPMISNINLISGLYFKYKHGLRFIQEKYKPVCVNWNIKKCMYYNVVEI